jgi:Ni/Fe-hydrogenase 1 B-type cytochrome subunit
MADAAQSIIKPGVAFGKEGGIARVYVWEWPVRITHWVIFLSIVVLSFTGYYMYDPFIIARGSRAYVMGTMRFIHEVTAFVFITAFLLRLYWFFKGNKWARWRQFLPISRQQRLGLWGQLKYYLFARRKHVRRIGHNPLAGATYAVIYALMLLEILTGLALYNLILGSKVLSFFISWLPLLINIQYLREIHFLIMFALGAFLIHHVYSSVLIGVEERSGLVGGMFSGYKFFPQEMLDEDAALDERKK